MSRNLARDKLQWNQDTPQMQYISTRQSILMLIENVDEGRGDPAKAFAQINLHAAELVLLAPYLIKGSW